MTHSMTPGILGSAPHPAMQSTFHGTRPTRFITQSHVVSAPAASKRALFVAAAIAVALYFFGRRLSD